MEETRRETVTTPGSTTYRLTYAEVAKALWCHIIGAPTKEELERASFNVWESREGSDWSLTFSVEDPPAPTPAAGEPARRHDGTP